MFACCRCANPKKDASGKSSKKDKQKKSEINQEQEQQQDNQDQDNKNVNEDDVVVIPAIQSENGITSNNSSTDMLSLALTEQRHAKVNVKSEKDEINHHQQKCIKDDDEMSKNEETPPPPPPQQPLIKKVSSSSSKLESAPVLETTPSTAAAEIANVTENLDLEKVATTIIVQTQSDSYENNQTSISPYRNNDNDQEIVCFVELNNLQTPDEDNNLRSIQLNGWGDGGAGDYIDLPQKSCLSRHNSTRGSMKKKVNISNNTEIIEASPIAVDPPSIADDDDVFSDSIPPPKRESMCAPYIEKDETTCSQGNFGLPEWFNEERINDIVCIDPPVTPVGRDELELKRHRLYSELMRVAQTAVEQRMCVNPPLSDVVTINGECDPDLKPSVAENLEILVNRLEKLVERLERSVSARELEIANKTFDSVLEKKRESFDLESTDLPPIPPPEFSASQGENLKERIDRIENSLSKLNDNYSNCSNSEPYPDGSLENIPTVLEEFITEELPPPPNMSLLGFQDIVNGPLSQYFALSSKIGGDVAKHAALVKLAFDAQLQYVTLATQFAQPSQDKQMELLKPTSTQISAIQDFREKNRASPFFNHLSAISESIPALGWVCVAPTPGPHVKEMNDAGQFYTNRVLKEWKEKDATHVEWARSWIQTLTELQQYIKQYHTTGLVWSGKGQASAASGGVPPPPPGCPPPPPPPVFDLAAMSLGDGSADERSALFAEINQGEAITKNLKRVTAEMQTHKNATLRTGPAPFKTPAQFGGAAATLPPAPKSVIKEPVFTRDGKKWIIEHYKNNPGLLVENAEMNNVVYVFKCENSTLTVKGKVNNIVMDSCKKCSLLFDSVVSSAEFVNCQSVQMQVMGFVPTISIDKTDGCQMFLSKESLGVEIISSKSSEMNVSIPLDNGDYVEQALPEQFKTTISGKTLKTICVDSLG